MAYTKDLPRKNGTAYLVLWRQDGRQVQETFDDPETRDKFLGLVKGYGDRYPPGWVPKVGFVTAEKPAEKPEPVLFVDHAAAYLKRKSGIDRKTRSDYQRLVDRLMTPWLGQLDVRDEEAFNEDTVAEWVNTLHDGEKNPNDDDKWIRRPYSPKYIHNLHGLLYQIMQAAVKKKYRSSNPCKDTDLPRVDAQIDEQMCFLEYDEFHLLYDCLPPEAQDVAVIAVSTGFRRGELFALKVKDVQDPDPGTVPMRVSVHRAWKEDDDRQPFLGPPKTKRARRTIAVSETGAEVIRRLIDGRDDEDFIIRDENDKPFPRGSKWYHRYWEASIPKAKARGLRKAPSLQDMRHTHASWLIGKNVPLPAVQRRLGHESITTTVDRYGHLIVELEAEALAAIEAAFERPRLRVVS